MLETFPDNISNKEKEVIGDDEEFHRRLEMTAVGVTEEEIRERLSFLEQLVKSPYRNITLFSDPSIGSFCCGIIPDQHVNEKGEIVLADVFDKMLQAGKSIYGYEFEGKWLECGNKLNWLKSNLYLSLKDPRFGNELKNFIRDNRLI